MILDEEKIKWAKLFKRDSEVLIVFQVPYGRKYYPEVIGINFRPRNLKHEESFYYIDKRDLVQEFLAIKEEYVRDPSFLIDLAEKTEKKGNELLKKTKELAENIENKSVVELKSTFEECNDLFTRYMPFVWILFPIEKLLTEIVTTKLKEIHPDFSEREITECFDLLVSLPFKESPAIREQKKILETAALLKKEGKITLKIEDEIEQIYREFSWAGAMRVGWTYLKDPYDLNHYKGLTTALAQGNPDRQLKEMNQKVQESKKKYDEYVFEKQIYANVIELADLLRRYIFLRTYRGEVIVKAMLNIRTLLEEIASRFNLKLSDIVYFTPEEIMKLLDSGEVPSYQARKTGYKLLILNGEAQVIGGLQPPKMELEAIHELKGEGIVGGIVRGKVSVILSKEDITKFAEGEILVTQMTSPDMMPAMMRASAIITDEGGLTCHAALISRELQIPCIIGTEIATKVLKDRDLVEVNSKEGIVRRIK